MNLRFYSPLVAEEKDFIKTLLVKSTAAQDTIYVISKTDRKFEESLEKIIRIEKATKDREAKPLTSEEENALSKYRKDSESLKNDDMPKLLENVCRNGTILIQGKEIKLDGRTIGAMVGQGKLIYDQEYYSNKIATVYRVNKL